MNITTPFIRYCNRYHNGTHVPLVLPSRLVHWYTCTDMSYQLVRTYVPYCYVVEKFFSRVKEFKLLGIKVPVERVWQLESAWVCALSATDLNAPLRLPVSWGPRSRPSATQRRSSWRPFARRRLAGRFLGCSRSGPDVCILCASY